MKDKETFVQLKKHLGDFFETDTSNLTLNSDLSDSFPGIESLRLLEMMVYLEECFNIEIDESVMDELNTMKDLVSYIDSKIS